uniref:Uncharacterized protein n=1 Tax=Brassica oleracea TaxID=3712 RepID=A0A3P6H6C7_BRAOL|nr:unnamed protein product [Brassica oleracea]
MCMFKTSAYVLLLFLFHDREDSGKGSREVASGPW